MNAVHPGAAATVASPDVQAVDIETDPNGATPKTVDNPEQVEDIDAWRYSSHHCYGYAINDDPREYQP